MFIRIRSGHRTWRAGTTWRTFTEENIGEEFKAWVSLSNHGPNDPLVERQLLIEGVEKNPDTVTVVIVGL